MASQNQNEKSKHCILTGNKVILFMSNCIKHLAKTKDELAHHIRALVYTQILDGDGWVDESTRKNLVKFLLEDQIDNQSGEDIEIVYQELFNSGILDKCNGEIFKRFQNPRLIPDNKGGFLTVQDTLIYKTEKQLNAYKKALKQEAIEFAKDERESAESKVDDEEWDD
jgi:hypothetical protein